MSSSAVVQSSRCVSVSYSFPLEWILNKNELETLLQSKIYQSDLYEFKSFKDLRFYLEIKSDWYKYYVNLKGSKMWLLKLDYVLVMSKDNAFKLKEINQLSFLNNFSCLDISKEDIVKIHCMVTACPVRPDSSTKETEELILNDGHKVIELESLHGTTLPNNYTNEAVIDFILKGTIPSFTVDIALDIIASLEHYKCEILKILCLKYLMNNINAQSLKKILQATVDYDLPQLQKECVRKITAGNFDIK